MGDCIFCKIASGEIPSPRIYENDHVIAIDDIHPVSKVHALIISKRHIESIVSLDPLEAGLLQGVQEAVLEVAKIKGIAESGFRMITNSGGDGRQTVPHLHYHIIGGQKLGVKIM